MAVLKIIPYSIKTKSAIAPAGKIREKERAQLPGVFKLGKISMAIQLGESLTCTVAVGISAS